MRVGKQVSDARNSAMPGLAWWLDRPFSVHSELCPFAPCNSQINNMTKSKTAESNNFIVPFPGACDNATLLTSGASNTNQ